MKINITFNGDIFQRFAVDEVFTEDYINYLKDEEAYDSPFSQAFPGSEKFTYYFKKKFIEPAVEAVKKAVPFVEVVADVDYSTAKKAVDEIECFTCYDRGEIEYAYAPDDIRTEPCPDCSLN